LRLGIPQHINMEQITEIIRLYSDGYSARSLATIHGVSASTITRWLKNNGILVRSPYDFSITSTNNRKTYFFNKDFFLKDSNELAYMMGFALADGNLYFSKKHGYAKLNFSIHQKDILILEYFQKISSYNKNIVDLHDRPHMKKLLYTDPIFRNVDFSKWGLVPRKTYHPATLNINHNYIRPFIIGYIDGDGSIRFERGKGYKFNIVGNKYIIDQIVLYINNLDSNFIFEWHWEDPPDKVWKRAILTKREQVLHLVKILEPWDHFHLPRKWDAAIEHIKNEKI
jgi:hypothetical protein